MLKVETQRWHQTDDVLREEALNAAHPRTRERFLALYEVTQGHPATEVGRKTNRNPQTNMAWVHRYNEYGPSSIVYQHTGGPPLCLLPSQSR